MSDHKDFNPESVSQAYSLFSELSEARKDVEGESFLTLRGSLRRIEEKAKTISMSERISSLSRKIENITEKLKELPGE
ncbi:hypothetical protein SCBWM1_gp115 [Synechococcus phage S-CBWM1]|uniref:Uncharacterized protein n=1 Tax=Synechococcus phage S-CBWM1 TaxID=2053653 RepID=A0A3G1L3P7_9CAUD|nr:hypothetical protein HOU61_gp082 [Synechococcus phage S-CBWM1]ATW62799.1 hypothetical protein SCBWM1_gp115 [Synechococcus phage S-CBWM1]